MAESIEEVVTLTIESGQIIGLAHKPIKKLGKPPIVMCHGFTGNKIEKDRLFVDFARRSSTQGYPTFRFDFTGSGDSSGEFEDTTLTRWIHEIKGVLTEIPRIFGSTDAPILLGLSLGGAAVIITASKELNITGVICWSPVANLLETFKSIFGESLWQSAKAGNTIQYFYETGCKLKPTFLQDTKRYNPINSIKEISPRPVLIIHGSGDEVVPIQYGLQLYHAARDPKQFVEIPQGDHVFTKHRERLFSETLTWLKTVTT